MVKLEPAGFPSKYLDCYESALMGILKYMGLAGETPLMGTQAYFVLEKEGIVRLRPSLPSKSRSAAWLLSRRRSGDDR